MKFAIPHWLSVTCCCSALAAGWLALSLDAVCAQDTTKQKAALDPMLQLLPRSPTWEQWQKSTGEMPPDFDALPSIPFLPDPLRLLDGQPVQSRAQWARRRQELLHLFQRYVIGSIPPPPGNVRVANTKAQVEAGVTIQALTLEFGPEHRAKLFMELILPPGTGPFPVFMTQDTHRRWALAAVSRGYIGCVYAGADSRDDTSGFIPIWPDYDWTKLARRAWAASRCLDYLLTLPIVDRARIALTGHSRNGKVSLIAGALDERFGAIISSSSGAGGACSFRFFSETQFGEGIELITGAFPDWLHPRLRFFAGRENKLPIDQHELIACIAPRPCLISTALNDTVESIWAIEQTYYAAQRVYAWLGSADTIGLRYRPGSHETRAEDIEAYLDWLDTRFSRRNLVRISRPVYPTYADWLQASNEHIDPQRFPVSALAGLLTTSGGNPILTPEQWTTQRDQIRQRIIWGLGQAPPEAHSTVGDYGAEPPFKAAMLNRLAVPEGLEKRSINFGNYLAGDLYYPVSAARSGQKNPVVIWLHPISNSSGYVAGYRRSEPVHIALARAGFAVFAFDQIGHGNRIEEAQRFYQRYPHWSLLGKTVQDTRAMVDAVLQWDFADARRIFVLGYATGGMAALHAAALDERIAGAISVAGFTPMRLDHASKGTGGVARWSLWLPLQPRLGAFIGQEARIPYDYHEVLALIAPRPVWVVAPKIDYQSNADDIAQCLAEAGKVYDWLGAKDKLQFYAPDEYNHLSAQMLQEVIQRLNRMAGSP